MVPEKSTGPGTGKKLVPEKVPVPEKFGPGKKYRYRYRKNLVPEKSTGPGTGKKWSRKKVPVPVPEKILGTVTLWDIVHCKEVFSKIPGAETQINIVRIYGGMEIVPRCVASKNV